MAQFDAYVLRDGGLAIDRQGERFDRIGTRLTVPLMPPGEAPPVETRLNPSFEIDGETLVMVTQFDTALRVAELHRKIGSLAEQRYRIIDAIDVLLGGG